MRVSALRSAMAVVLGLLALAAGPTTAETVPPRHIALSNNMDFPGNDLTPIFETDYNSCRAACLGDAACVAFTYNASSNACFPKSAVGEGLPFQGAVSARVYDVAPAILRGVDARAGALDFLGASDLGQARALAEDLPNRHVTGEWTAPALLDAARDARNSGAPLSALRFTGAALAVTDAADSWVEYSRLALGLEGESFRETRDWRETALSAAVNGYLRSDNPGLQASALVAMAVALEDLGRGRDMIPALRLSDALQPRQDTKDALAAALARHGFRVVEHRVDSDSAAPRVCAVFSEPLRQGGVDYASFLSADVPGLAVEAEESQLCITGVTHGARYRLGLRQGLPAASGEVLSATVDLNVYVRDRSPSARFPGRGYVVPQPEVLALPVTTVNVETLDLVLSRVPERAIQPLIEAGLWGRPLDQWEVQDLAATRVVEVWRGTAEIDSVLNTDLTTRLPLAEATKVEGVGDGTLPPGLYLLTATPPQVGQDEANPATQWFLVSDLGVTSFAGRDGMTVITRSLSDAGAIEGAEVALIARSNAVLGRAITDADGVAHFPAGLLRGSGGAEAASLSITAGNGDFTFLSLVEPEMDLSDRGVAGRAPAPPIDVFLATDRDAYRPGEEVFVTALTRGPDASALDGVPLIFVLTRPDGVEYSRTVAEPLDAGGTVLSLPIADTAPRGGWILAAHADADAPPLASVPLLVEAFLPERMDLTLDLPDAPLAPSGILDIGVEARFLFGAPAVGMDVSGLLRLSATRTLDGFPGVQFGRHDTQTSATAVPLEQIVTNADGRGILSARMPDLPATDRPVEASVTVELREGNARPVEREEVRALAATGPMLGLKPLFNDVAPQGSNAQLEVVGLSADLTALPMDLTWTATRVERRYQWYQIRGDWQWEPITRRTRVADGAVSLDANGRAMIELPVDWGQYEVAVARVGASSGTADLGASIQFYAGWGGAEGDPSATPDRLEVSLDAASYAPGDVAQLTFEADRPGTALVAVLGDRMRTLRFVEVSAGTQTLNLEVGADWGPGAYATVTLLSPGGSEALPLPRRAMGLVHVPIAPGARQLGLSLEVPQITPAQEAAEVVLRLTTPVEGPVYATLAAVDVGILNITGFEGPDPEGHYFGQRALGVGIRDLYGRLIDASQGALGRVRSGGDAMSKRTSDAPPPTEDLAVYTFGPLTFDAQGEARVSIPGDGFNGTLRLMAVAWSGTAVGSAEAEVIRRDPVVLAASLPRFLAPGDESVLTLDLTHVEGPVAPVRVDVSVTGPVELLRSGAHTLRLVEGARSTLTLPIRAGEAVGDATLTVRFESPGGTGVQRTYGLGVRSNDPEVLQARRVTLAAGESLTLSQDILSDFRPGTGHVLISSGALAQFDAPGLLAALDRYPWGCTEQVTSRAMPLLFAQPLAEAIGVASDLDITTRVADAVGVVLSRQTAAGAFGLWAPYAGDMWLDSYVTDFLSRARAAGHAVPDQPFRNALDNLRNQVNYASDFDDGGEGIAYALMVLAREGAAAIGDLRYYADVKARAFATPLAQAQLAVALATYGEAARAQRMLALAEDGLTTPRAARDQGLWRSDYGTPRRDAAGVLGLAIEAGLTLTAADPITRLAAGEVGQPRSTQESVWALLAAQGLATGPGMGLTLDGQAQARAVLRLGAEALSPARTLGTTATAQSTLVLSSFGVPRVPVPAGGNGYRIDRLYFTMDGAPIQPDQVAVGTRLVTVLKVTPLGNRAGRLMVTDPLPAGFEIDNPNLLASGDVAALEFLSLNAYPEYQEFRADRFLAAVDWRQEQPFQLAYIVRAVSEGAFAHPAASVEDMYRPHLRAQTSAGRVDVIR